MRAVGFVLANGLLAVLSTAGCSCAAPSVTVDLRTDLVPAREFVRIETTLGAASLDDATTMDGGTGPLRQTAHHAVPSENYVAGVRVAELGTLAAGNYLVRVNVLDASSRIIASRRIDVTVTGHTAITVTVTRNCVGVSCPPSTDPLLTECADNQCIDPRCTASTPQFCPTPTCMQDSDCHADGCGHATCAGGTCLVVPDDTRCATGQICFGDFSCITAPPDGDAGTSVFGDIDAASDVDSDVDAWAPDPDAYTADDVSTATDDDASILPPEDATVCIPGADCAALGWECGTAIDSCGTSHDCGTCGMGLGCNVYHRCQSACVPAALDMVGGGGLCGDLNEAYTARGINVGYYPFRVRSAIPMYSGDFDGAAGSIFTRGPTHGGVVMQVIRPGAYVGLSSTGPFYDPPSGDCSPSGMSCGDPDRAACGSAMAPPMRAPRSGYVWGYAYSGGSHMQGWIPQDWERLVFAGFDPNHPCARGPAGLDYEVHSACGMTTSCAGYQSSCPATNSCNEGSDDCGRTECGAMSGGALTPSAWQRTVTNPGGHTCSMHVLYPSIHCLANGSDADFFLVYPFGAYLYWAQNSTTKAWLHYGDRVQAYYHTRDHQGVLWDFVEVTHSSAPTLTPASDGAGASSNQPCLHGGTCGWVQDVFLVE